MRTNGGDEASDTMTKRESAAVAAMAGLLAASSGTPDTKHLAFIATAAADALFDELAR